MADLQIAVLAIGTRGDVQPLLALTLALHDAIPGTYTFFTHQAHHEWLEPPVRAAGLRLRLTTTPPARDWWAPAAQPPERHMQDCSPPVPAVSADDARSRAASQEQHSEELIAACEEAFGRSLPAGGDAASCRRKDPVTRLIIFNLFGWEAFHIAEALGVACLAASPCLVPYAMPASFERRFQQAHPQLYQQLLARERQGSGSGGSDSSSVGWSDVRHWLWPAFMERWGTWRHHRLGLPAVPFSNRAALPLPPPLLYGVSEHVVPRPGFWPDSVHLCGYWASLRSFPASQQHLPRCLLSVLADALETDPQQSSAADGQAAPPVCVDFGSMGRMGLLPQPLLLVAVLEAAAGQLRRRIVLLTGGWQPLLDACSHKPSKVQWILPLEHPVAHSQLLPHCSVLLHHGGAGTVGAALRCGIPQLICPLHFDQQQWAERVTWLCCGSQIAAAALLQVRESKSSWITVNAGGDQGQSSVGGQSADSTLQQEELTLRVEQAGKALAKRISTLLEDPHIQQQCLAMKQQLAREDGLQAAVKIVQQHLQQQEHGDAAGESQGAAVTLTPAAGAHKAAAQRLLLPDGLSITCISPPEALFIHKEIFQDDCYQLTSWAAGVEDAIVVDAGANIGLFVLRLLLDPSVAASVQHIYAFEPLPATADVLEANLQHHGVADRVSVARCGLHSHEGTSNFMFYPAMPGNSTMLPEEKWQVQRPAMAAVMGQERADKCFQGAVRVDCPVTTLAAFVSQQKLSRIDLLKVDVEGAELEVLRGMDAASWAVTEQVVAEVHNVADRPAAVRGLLDAQGFSVQVEHGVGGNLLMFGRRPWGRQHKSSYASNAGNV